MKNLRTEQQLSIDALQRIIDEAEANMAIQEDPAQQALIKAYSK